MGIYSTNNRIRSSWSESVRLNKRYTDEDFGLIMYESVVNDQNFFKAMVASDIQELTGLREGTLLESEIESLNEASVKEFFKKVQQRLKEFWEKIKSAIKSAIDKVGAYIFKNCNSIKKAFETATKDPKNRKNAKVEARKETSDLEKLTQLSNITKLKSEMHTRLGAVIHDSNAVENYKSLEKGLLMKRFLGQVLGESCDSVSDYKSKAIKKAFSDSENITVSYDEVRKYVDELKDDKKEIKVLQSTSKSVESSIKELSKEFKAMENKNVEHKSVVAAVNAITTAYENTVTGITSTAVALVKIKLKNKKSIITQYIRQANGGKLTESAIEDIVADTEAETSVELDQGPEDSTVDSDIQSEIDDIIDEVDDDDMY